MDYTGSYPGTSTYVTQQALSYVNTQSSCALLNGKLSEVFMKTAVNGFSLCHFVEGCFRSVSVSVSLSVVTNQVTVFIV